MQKHLIHISLFLILFACTTPTTQRGQKDIAIIDDAFISMIDTIGYSYHSLRPAPNDIIYRTSDSLHVAITPKLVSIRKWEKHILIELSKRSGTNNLEYKNLLYQSNTDSAEIPISINAFTHTGRYKLFPYAQVRKISIDTLSAIGKVEFSRVYYDEQENIAMVVAIIRDQIKNGIVKLFLLKKIGSHWVKSEEFVLVIW